MWQEFIPYIIESCIYRVPKAEISKCGTDKFATYIYGQYRFIPASSSDPIQIGSDEHESVNVDQKAYGVLESKGFPVWQENVNFNLQLTSLNTSKAIRFYFIDLDIEDADFSDSVCKSSFIGLNDGVSYSNLDFCYVKKLILKYTIGWCKKLCK